MEPATPAEPGVWELSPNLKPALTQLSERMDTIQLMRDALGEQAAERAVSTFLVNREMPHWFALKSDVPSGWFHVALRLAERCCRYQAAPLHERAAPELVRQELIVADVGHAFRRITRPAADETLAQLD